MNAFTDWQPTMQSVIERFAPKKILEFGVGVGTQWLLDNFKQVGSFELLCNPELESWYPDMQKKYKNYKNWTTMFLACEDKMDSVVKSQVNKQIKFYAPDVVFVDPGVHFRGDLVNLALRAGVKYVLAHDTRCGFDENDIYGWNKIDSTGYTKEEVYTGQGTTLWIKN